MTILTLQTLKDKGACSNARLKFRRRFGPEGDITEELCVSVADVFSWDWAARHLLTPSARAEYQRAIAPARAEYERARAVAWAEYRRARAATRGEYDRARAAVWAEYERAEAAAWAEYERASAAAWARSYNNQ